MLKRATAALALMFMFHLTTVGADIACGQHAPRDMAASMAHGHPMHGHGKGSKPCDTPLAAHCCTAMISCSSVPMPVGSMVAERTSVAIAAPIGHMDVPASITAAPETPPPRA